ncbi:MAG: hypothetical protein ACK5TE_13870, partial [Pseudomonadota bacterium]
MKQSEFMKHRIVGGLQLSAAAVLLAAGTAMAQTDRGAYLIDGAGNAVRAASYGVCVRSNNWTPAQATEQCDPDLIPRKAAAPAPRAAPRSPVRWRAPAARAATTPRRARSESAATARAPARARRPAAARALPLA